MILIIVKSPTQDQDVPEHAGAEFRRGRIDVCMNMYI